jgi:hypothetical protein
MMKVKGLKGGAKPGTKELHIQTPQKRNTTYLYPQNDKWGKDTDTLLFVSSCLPQRMCMP